MVDKKITINKETARKSQKVDRPWEQCRCNYKICQQLKQGQQQRDKVAGKAGKAGKVGKAGKAGKAEKAGKRKEYQTRMMVSEYYDNCSMYDNDFTNDGNLGEED